VVYLPANVSIRFAGAANARNEMQKQAVPIWLADAAYIHNNYQYQKMFQSGW
jgi:hypothetical protein